MIREDSFTVLASPLLHPYATPAPLNVESVLSVLCGGRHYDMKCERRSIAYKAPFNLKLVVNIGSFPLFLTIVLTASDTKLVYLTDPCHLLLTLEYNLQSFSSLFH